MFVFVNKNFMNATSLSAKVLRSITRLFITLSDTVILLVIESYHLVESLIKKFLILITCRVKTRFVLKRCSPDILTCNFFYKFLLVYYYKKILVLNYMINRFEYEVQIRSIHVSFSFTQKNIASKKQVENTIFLNKAIVDKPFLIRKYVASYGFVLLKLRRKYNGIFLACFLTDSFVKTKFLSREFSSTVEIESERFKRSILEDLRSRKWPTNCIKNRKALNDYVQNVQNQILFYKRDQQLDFIASHVFDIENRIFSINKVFNESKSSSYGQIGYNDLTLKSHKFIFLKQTKWINVSKLPSCEIIMVEIPKSNGGKRSFSISMPVDKVLQRMFLNFLDVLIEEDLKPEVFAYRKGRDPRMAVASVYAKLNWVKYNKQICLCSVDIEKCFENFFHHQIIEQYPFPKSYVFLLFRWLTPNLINKNHDFKNLVKVTRGVLQGSTVGSSIANLLLSNAFPGNILTERKKNRQKIWADILSYADNIILIANDPAIFFHHFTQFRKNLKNIGLSLNNIKTESFVCIKSKIKFQFLGFEFFVIPRDQLKKSAKSFDIILRPSLGQVKAIKKRLKVVIKRILHKSRKEIYKSFQQINFMLLDWASFYYFSQGCIYGKRVDNFVFRYLRKILVKKFWYNGLLRPKWVAYHFLGLGKINPNGQKWQPLVLYYVKNASKVIKHVHIWYCGNSFFRLSIISFLLNFKICKKNYYAFPDIFKRSLNKLIIKWLKSDLKVKLYGE